jgi:diguanylate cyclase (GGDEF)-like protein
VERVHQSGQALVVTGNEEGAALGSRSSVIHGLRSIMIAPLQLKDRLLGVVYLDSRAARGIFTTDDVDILAAITNHVAMSLETARAAQLELAVHAAHRERDLAETLRQAMADLVAVLDPAEVTARLTATVARVLPVHSVVLVHRPETGGPATIAAVHPAAPAGTTLDLPQDAVLGDLLSTVEPQHATCEQQTAPLPGLLGPDITAWLAIPMTARGHHRGLLIAATTGQPYTDAEVEIAAALTGQGMAALDNALLFQQVTALAQNDPLTGLFNRRRFTDLAGHTLAEDRPTAALMIDIDHFKKVNDTHGHGVGDQVIQTVAQRLASQLRAGDIICRYGGEEFAVLLADTPAEQAKHIAERLHAAVTHQPVPTDAGDLTVTVSVGLARTTTSHGRELHVLLNRADAALYQAKGNGRNQVAQNTDV